MASVTVTVGAPAKLVMATQPGGTVQDGAQLSPPPVVKLQDALGNDVKTGGRSITAALVSSPSGATLNGDATRTTDGNGSASFNNLSIVGPVGSYTLRFTSGSLTAVYLHRDLPHGGTGQCRQVHGERQSQLHSRGTEFHGHGDGARRRRQSHSGCERRTGGDRLEQHPGPAGSDQWKRRRDRQLLINQPGHAHDHGQDQWGGGAANAVITVTPGPVSASQSSVGAAPNAIPAGGGPSTVTVTARDAAGNPISGASVSLSVSGGGNTVSAPGATNANGVTTASFTSTEAGDHVITATINGVTIGDTLTVSVQAGPPASLSFVQGPTTTQAGQNISPPVVVAVRDQFGNLATGQVEMSLVVPFLASGTLNGTTSVTAFVGIATFTDLSVSSPALLAYQLTATLGSLSVTSNGFIVTP